MQRTWGGRLLVESSSQWTSAQARHLYSQQVLQVADDSSWSVLHAMRHIPCLPFASSAGS